MMVGDDGVKEPMNPGGFPSLHLPSRVKLDSILRRAPEVFAPQMAAVDEGLDEAILPVDKFVEAVFDPVVFPPLLAGHDTFPLGGITGVRTLDRLPLVAMVGLDVEHTGDVRFEVLPVAS